MSKFIKPTSDFFIRYLFGSEEYKELLLSFINSVMVNADFPALSTVEIKNPFNLKNIVFEKESILDVKATDKSGRQYNIEVQSEGDQSFKARSLYYWAKLYTSQLNEGDLYKTLRPTICINVLDFELVKNIKRPHTCFMLHEIKEPEFVFTDHLMLHFLELPKLIISTHRTKLERWLTFLKCEGKEEDIMTILIQEDKDIEKAHNVYNKFTHDEMMQELYEAREKFKKDYNSMMAAKIAEAEKKGKIEDKCEIAKKMKDKGYNVETIAELTDLAEEEIEKL